MPASLTGQNLGEYRVLEPLGSGGMARVYRGYHPQLDRFVAIKVLRSDLVDDELFLTLDIQRSVFEKFGIKIEPEVNVV